MGRSEWGVLCRSKAEARRILQAVQEHNQYHGEDDEASSHRGVPHRRGGAAAATAALHRRSAGMRLAACIAHTTSPRCRQQLLTWRTSGWLGAGGRDADLRLPAALPRPALPLPQQWRRPHPDQQVSGQRPQATCMCRTAHGTACTTCSLQHRCARHAASWHGGTGRAIAASASHDREHCRVCPAGCLCLRHGGPTCSCASLLLHSGCPAGGCGTG